MQHVAKKSASKSSVGGLKVAGRMRDATGRATTEVIVACDSREAGLEYLASIEARPLQVELISNGKICEQHRDHQALANAAQRHRAARAELPYEAWRLSEGDPALQIKRVSLPAAGASAPQTNA